MGIMSLKAFHIAFIAASTLLAFGFSIWAVLVYVQGGHWTMLLAAAVSMIFGFGLIVYGVRFLRKLKHVRFL
jgi:hypothetical protein